LARRRRGGSDGDSGGSPGGGGPEEPRRDSRGRQIQHSVQRAEQNLIWELAHDVWRPVRRPDFDDAQRAAHRRGQHLPEPRAGHPVHARPGGNRIPRDRHDDMADELGYEPTGETGVNNIPIYRSRDGRPPEYIAYDMDGHGTLPRDANGKGIPYDPNHPDTTAPPASWKGADDPDKLRNRHDRDGTYIPEYDSNGDVTWRQPRKGK
jgi:hypothetical protein